MKKLGDAAIALVVVACSVVLLLALAFSLQGNPFAKPSRTLRAQFTDITGIQRSSLVKYGGATAGNVESVRMLSPEERAKSANPAMTVEILMALGPQVPELNEGIVASIASDTLLSDKFVLLSGGDPSAPVLANGALVPSIPPVTFDAILRDLDETLDAINSLAGDARKEGLSSRIDALMTQLEATLNEACGLIGGANTMVDEGRGLVKNGNTLIAEAGELVTDGRGLISETREPLKNLLSDLSDAAQKLDELAQRADKLLKENEGNLNATFSDGRKAVADLKIAAASARELIDSLKARPQQLIWGPGRQKKENR